MASTLISTLVETLVTTTTTEAFRSVRQESETTLTTIPGKTVIFVPAIMDPEHKDMTRIVTTTETTKTRYVAAPGETYTTTTLTREIQDSTTTTLTLTRELATVHRTTTVPWTATTTTTTAVSGVTTVTYTLPHYTSTFVPATTTGMTLTEVETVVATGGTEMTETEISTLTETVEEYQQETNVWVDQETLVPVPTTGTQTSTAQDGFGYLSAGTVVRLENVDDEADLVVRNMSSGSTQRAHASSNGMGPPNFVGGSCEVTIAVSGNYSISIENWKNYGGPSYAGDINVVRSSGRPVGGVITGIVETEVIYPTRTQLPVNGYWVVSYVTQTRTTLVAGTTTTLVPAPTEGCATTLATTLVPTQTLIQTLVPAPTIDGEETYTATMDCEIVTTTETTVPGTTTTLTEIQVPQYVYRAITIPTKVRTNTVTVVEMQDVIYVPESYKTTIEIAKLVETECTHTQTTTETDTEIETEVVVFRSVYESGARTTTTLVPTLTLRWIMKELPETETPHAPCVGGISQGFVPIDAVAVCGSLCDFVRCGTKDHNKIL